MISLIEVYKGNAFTRQVKRATQKAIRVHSENIAELTTLSAMTTAVAKVAVPDIPMQTIFAGAMAGSGIIHYCGKSSNRLKAKEAIKELRTLKASDEYQKILTRAKSIRKVKP